MDYSIFTHYNTYVIVPLLQTQECKTYKIIMSKLDELNKRFGSTHPPRAHPSGPRAPSSGSVSVCDKLVATDPHKTVDECIKPIIQVCFCWY